MTTKLREKYSDLVQYCKSNDDAYNMLKQEYCDICSNGDVYINAIIDNIYNHIDSNNMITNNDGSLFTYYYHSLAITNDDENYKFEVPKICNERFNSFCDHICNTIEYFLQGGKPDPFWWS